MTFTIDTTTYRRDRKWSLGDGYDRRTAPPSSMIIHTTNGNKGTRFEDEAAFLRDNHPADPRKRVSSSYLVGKQGQIAQIVDDTCAPWHAGECKPGWSNTQSLGIECHLTPGEQWTQVQMDALTWLVWRLMGQYRIPTPLIETHRTAALPKGRKSDPAEWSDTAFYAWRDSLAIPPATHPILNGPSIPASAIVAFLDKRAAHLTWQQRSSLTCAFSAFGAITTIGNLRPLAQAWKETGGFTSDKFLRNYNPAGLGATNDGAEGAKFATIESGVAAQYAHLLCYAAPPAALPQTLLTFSELSPRRSALIQTFGLGCAPNWEDLNGKWAFPGPTYGQDILTIAAIIETPAGAPS